MGGARITEAWPVKGAAPRRKPSKRTVSHPMFSSPFLKKEIR